VLHAIGRGFEDVFGPPLSWIWHHVLLSAFSGIHATLGDWAWVLLAVVAIAIGVVAGVLLARRRTRIAAGAPADIGAPEVEDVASLDAAAIAAEAKGHHDEAVRLRFRAGLARLEAAGVIASRLVATDQQVHRAVRSQTFDRLASAHEAIAYAGARATPSDSASAREGWPRVVDEARSTRLRSER
jgi:hypothetical protein